MDEQTSDYTFVIAKRFVKDFRKLTKTDQKCVRESMDKILLNPLAGRKVKNAEIGQYRWRVGNLRVRYDVIEFEIHLLRVIKREDVYRKF